MITSLFIFLRTSLFIFLRLQESKESQLLSIEVPLLLIFKCQSSIKVDSLTGNFIVLHLNLTGVQQEKKRVGKIMELRSSFYCRALGKRA